MWNRRTIAKRTVAQLDLMTANQSSGSAENSLRKMNFDSIVKVAHNETDEDSSALPSTDSEIQFRNRAMELHLRLLKSFRWKLKFSFLRRHASLRESALIRFQTMLLDEVTASNRHQGGDDRAIERISSWDIEGFISDFAADIDSLIEDSSNNSSIVERTRAVLALNNSEIWRRRVKWLSSKLLLMAISYAQMDLQRRMARSACEKRITEVPEFPLL